MSGKKNLRGGVQGGPREDHSAPWTPVSAEFSGQERLQVEGSRPLQLPQVSKEAGKGGAGSEAEDEIRLDRGAS